jgi:hypothetical protein
MSILNGGYSSRYKLSDFSELPSALLNINDRWFHPSDTSEVRSIDPTQTRQPPEAVWEIFAIEKPSLNPEQ